MCVLVVGVVADVLKVSVVAVVSGGKYVRILGVVGRLVLDVIGALVVVGSRVVWTVVVVGRLEVVGLRVVVVVEG